MSIKILKGKNRYEWVNLLNQDNLIGIELGVATGIFSKKMVQTGKFKAFFGVDKYSDHHDLNQYKDAIKNVGLLENYKLIKLTFEEAHDLFEDEFFDFIYIDGYAHNGQLGGQTICKWINKVKIGGLICGDDYHEKFPLTVDAVNYIKKQTQLDLLITDIGAESDHKFPSWAFKIDKKYEIKVKRELVIKSKFFDIFHKFRIKIKKILFK